LNLEKQSASNDTLGGRLVHARETLDISISQLARRLGVETKTLQAWETDRSEPRSNKLLTIAGILNISPAWLLTGEGERPGEGAADRELQQMGNSVKRLRGRVAKIADELGNLEERLADLSGKNLS